MGTYEVQVSIRCACGLYHLPSSYSSSTDNPGQGSAGIDEGGISTVPSYNGGSGRPRKRNEAIAFLLPSPPRLSHCRLSPGTLSWRRRQALNISSCQSVSRAAGDTETIGVGYTSNNGHRRMLETCGVGSGGWGRLRIARAIEGGLCQLHMRMRVWVDAVGSVERNEGASGPSQVKSSVYAHQ